MSFLMVGFAIDVAIRAFKLVILKMIAPIPIISYIDPKSAKDGAFSNWTKTFISTWIDLFLRLGILYFVLYMIDLVILRGNISIGQNNFLRTAVVTIFLIIGLLFFARQAPKFISDALGIKNSKGLGIGLGGALAAGGAFLGGAGLAGALMAGTTAMNENADAAAQGKAGTASWGKGRDLAAQLKTGDKNAKAGLTQSLARQLDDRAKINSGVRNAKKLGLTAKNEAGLKANMFAREDDYKKAQDEFTKYQTGVQSGVYEYDEKTAEALQQKVRATGQIYQDAQRAYEKAKTARESLVPKNTAVDDYSKRQTYRAKKNSDSSKPYERGIYDVGSFNKKLESNIEDKPGKYKYKEDIKFKNKNNNKATTANILF